MEQLLLSIDYIGTFVFAITGATIAAKSDYDFFGMFFLAFLTAVGGGTIRDIILNLPVFWTLSPIYLYIITGATFLSLFFRFFDNKAASIIFFLDSLGLGLFAITGTQIAISNGSNFETSIIMGTITAVLGGVLRAVFNNEEPIIFKKEVYATTAILSSLLFILLINTKLNHSVTCLLVIIFCTLTRYISVKYKLHLPKAL